MEDKREEAVRKIRESLEGGKLPCAVAHDIARETGVSLGEIGRIANELSIKISQCELGCF